MKKEIIISGFGGQGVLSMGKILAYSGLMEGKEVTWMPAYGPEQRGGTANVTVIVSDDRISSPILSRYDIAIVLNQPSLDKFEPKVKPGGILIYDSYGILNPPTRKDIEVYSIHAMDKAAEMKNAKIFNMIVLGGLLQSRKSRISRASRISRISRASRISRISRASRKALGKPLRPSKGFFITNFS